MTPDPRPPSLTDSLDPLACLEELWDEPPVHTGSLPRDLGRPIPASRGKVIRAVV